VHLCGFISDVIILKLLCELHMVGMNLPRSCKLSFQPCGRYSSEFFWRRTDGHL